VTDLRPGSKIGGNLYANAAAITPNDAVDVEHIYPALKIGATGGTITGIPAGAAPGASTVVINVAANEVLKLAFRRIYATGTTATTITGLW
jgi:hypothetical protein